MYVSYFSKNKTNKSSSLEYIYRPSCIKMYFMIREQGHQDQDNCGKSSHQVGDLHSSAKYLLSFIVGPVIDGGWGDWILLQDCTSNCSGIQIRLRLCDSPPPSGGGEECQGTMLESTLCAEEGECKELSIGELLVKMLDAVSHRTRYVNFLLRAK